MYGVGFPATTSTTRMILASSMPSSDSTAVTSDTPIFLPVTWPASTEMGVAAYEYVSSQPSGTSHTPPSNRSAVSPTSSASGSLAREMPYGRIWFPLATRPGFQGYSPASS